MARKKTADLEAMSLEKLLKELEGSIEPEASQETVTTRDDKWPDEVESLLVGGDHPFADHAYWDDSEYKRVVYATRRMQLFCEELRTMSPMIMAVRCMFGDEPTVVIARRLSLDPTDDSWTPLFVFVTPEMGRKLHYDDGVEINGYWSDMGM